MRTLLLSLVIGGLVFARPVWAGEDPLAPLTVDEDPLAPLTAEPGKPKQPGKPKPKPKPPPDTPKPPPPDKPVKPPPPEKPVKPPPEKPVKPPVEKVETPKKANAEKIKVSGVPPMPLKPSQSVTLTFKVMDPAGKPVPVELSLTASIGTITSAVEVAPGVYTATFAPPANGTENIATIHAEVKNGVKAVFSETKVGMSLTAPAPPPPEKPIKAEVPKAPKAAKIAFADAPKTEAGEPVKVRFQVEDDRGNPISPEGITLKSDAGKFENVREESGTYVADFTPGKDRTGDVGIYAEAGGQRLAGEGNVVVKAASTGGNFGFAAGVFVGGLTNFGKVASPQFELNLEAKLFHVVRVGVLTGYSPAFAPNVKEQAATGREADFQFTVIPLLLRAAYQQSVGPIDVFGGGMIGVAFVSAKGTAKNSTVETTFSKTSLDMAAFIGAGLTLGPGMLVAEIRASWLKVDYSDPAVAVKGSLGGFAGALGYKFEF